MVFDDRQITGVNIWLKPAKFAISISVYLFTMAWLLGVLRRPSWLLDRQVAYRGRRLAAITLAALAWAALTLWVFLTALAARTPFGL